MSGPPKPPAPLAYVPGRDVNADAFFAKYGSFLANPRLQRSEKDEEERDVEDALGEKATRVAHGDAWYYAKSAAEDMLKAALVLQAQHRLTPEELVFAVHLIALNVFNAADLPIARERMAELAKLAEAHYVAVRKTL